MLQKIKKIIKYVLPKVILEKLLGFYFRNKKYYYDEDFLNYVYSKKKGLIDNKNRVETLVLRGSNADFGFDPSEFPNSYNLGLTSTDLYSSYYIYQSVSKELPNLKNVIIYLNPASIGFELARTKEKYRLLAYKYFFDVPIKYDFVDAKAEKKVLLAILKVKNKNKKNSSMNDGYVKRSGCHETYEALERVKTHLRENERVPDQIYWLKNLVDVLEWEGKNAYLIITPMRSDYIGFMPSGKDIYKKIYDVFDDRIIMNYYNDADFSDEDMYDTDHLNEKGAQKLTRKIFKRIKK